MAERKKRAITCSVCAATREAKGLGNGWQEVAQAIYCKTCLRQRFRLLALTFPVSECVGLEWPEFCGLIHEQWRAMTSLANWTERELAKRDVVRMPADTKLATMPAVYLYPDARRAFPEIEPTTITSVVESVTGDYKSKRFRTIWQRTATHDVQRYPTPIPLHNQTWTPSYDEAGNPCVALKLGRTAEDKPRWVTIRLRGDATMRRQLTSFAVLMRGEGRKCELSLYGKRSMASKPHGKATTLRTPGGGQKRNYKIMCKLVCWLPKQPQTERTKSMLLHTDLNAFWVAQIGTHETTSGFIPGAQEAWILNADHIKRRAAEHLAWCGQRDGRETASTEVKALAHHINPERIAHQEQRHTLHRQRVSEDTKYEKRWPKRKRLQINEALSKRCVKHNRQMDDWCKQVVALLLGYAQRQQVAEIYYRDDERSFLPSFRWSELETTLRNACEAVNIAVFPPREREKRKKDAAENEQQTVET